MTSLTVDSDNLLLLTGDIEGEIILLFCHYYGAVSYFVSFQLPGYLCLWKIEKYCVGRSATLPPKSKTNLYSAYYYRQALMKLIRLYVIVVTLSNPQSTGEIISNYNYS